MPIFSPSDNSEPAVALRSVAPHASNNLPDGVCRALWVGGGGNISLIAETDTAPVVLVGVGAGVLLPIRVKAVRTTGTTATDIVAFY